MNLKIEQEILISMIFYPNFIEQFLNDVPLSFFSFKGAACLEKILELNDKKALSPSSLLTELTSEQKKDDYFLNLFSLSPNANFLSLKESFIKNFKLNKQTQNAKMLLRASENNELLDLSLLELDLKDSDTSFKNLNDWISFYQAKPEIPKFKTGVKFLDEVFEGGIELAQLVLISGDPEAGKTTLGVQILENISKVHKTCFFSFEFTIQKYIESCAFKKFNFENMIIINSGYEIYTIIQNIKKLYRQGVRVFLIDSQMRITSPNGRNMEEEESLKFSSLAKLCHSLDILIFLIVQTSKGDRDNPMGSKKGGHEASITIRIEHDKAKNELREFSEDSRIIILKKNKQTGKHFKEKVVFDRKNRIFKDLEREKSKISQEIELEDIKKSLPW